MAGISISKIFIRRRIMTAVTMVSALILVFFAVSMLATKNPSSTKAAATLSDGSTSCTISGTGTYSLLTSAACDNKDLVINGDGTDNGLIVEIAGSHNFTNVTITNGAKLTHQTIAVADIESDGITLKATGLLKKVDLTVTGKLELTNHGRIDVSGKGFPKGINSHPYGYGPGGGASTNGYSGITSGAYGGNSCEDANCILKVVAYGNADSPIDNGSGGGYVSGRDSVVASGGGIIKINVQEMSLDQDEQTFINANGVGGGSPSSYAMVGGAGGSIWIKATNLTTSYPLSGDHPFATGSRMNYLYGFDGTVKIVQGGTLQSLSNVDFGKYITANGGPYGGAGGRIKIEIDNLSVDHCHITGGTSIPAACENQDVVIDGDVTVDAGAIKIQQDNPARPACTSSTVAQCDSKRKFNSLTIKNGAVLTHAALTYTELTGTSSQDMDSDFSIADETTGSARWKKVDVEIAGELRLESGGKIDVSGKGYPGSWYEVCGGNTYNTLVAREGVFADIGDGLGTNPPTGGYNHGFGPSGGLSLTEYDRGRSGGGGYGGSGGPPNNFVDNIGMARSYYTNNKNILEYGSGGGAAGFDGDRADTACGSGGDGGGKVVIAANKIVIASSASSIKANGFSPQETTAITGRPLSTEDNMVGQGGGSGGLIYLRINGIEFSGTGFVSGDISGGIANAEVGQIELGGVVSSLPYNLSVKGGDSREGGDGDKSSGGGGGWIVVGPLVGTNNGVKKQLFPVRRNGGEASDECLSNPIAANSNCFNPYALQSGDIIKIVLEVANISSGIELKDKPLVGMVNGTQKACVPKPVADPTYPASPSGASISNNEITWSNITEGTEYSYYCVMQ